MSHLVLARKYRPSSFLAVFGQEHVTRTLANSIKSGKIAHAYLFCGPRGIGKTSIARIFSKALNCDSGPTSEPCQECRNCKEITAGTSLAVREIDGASHTSVENVRELISTFRSLPPPGSKFKIYIIDEVHMLSASAFNALLKSLEEPPPNTVFMLATTEPHKIPDTVISRCQRHDLRAMSRANIETCLRDIINQEKIEVEPEVLRLIARLADGSMRDAQSLLERAQSFCEGKIAAAETAKLLGSVSRETLMRITRGIFDRDVSVVLAELDGSFRSGAAPTLFLKEFAAHWREIFLAKCGGPESLQRIGLTAEEIQDLTQLIAGVSVRDVQDLAQLAREGADAALISTYPIYSLEALLVRMATREPVRDLGELLGRLKTLILKERSEGVQPESGSVAAQKKNLAKKAAAAPSVTASTSAASSEEPELAAAIEESAELDWPAFAEYVSGSGEPMLAEHLRRLSVDRFMPGILEGRGPEFSRNCLETEQNWRKLCGLLRNFSGCEGWQVKLLDGELKAGVQAGSIVDKEQTRAANVKARRQAAVQQHPIVQNLKKVFPGSEIDES